MTKPIRWMLGLCIAADLLTLLLFWTPLLLGYEFGGWLGRFQAQVSTMANPLLVPALIVLFVIVSIREPAAPQ